MLALLRLKYLPQQNPRQNILDFLNSVQYNALEHCSNTGGTAMDNRETLIQAASALIEEKGERLDELTVREICKKAGVGLGLVNYHFRSKDKLIELCIERMVNKVVEQFQHIREKTAALTPFEKLNDLGNMTLSFLFEHQAMARISILTDMQTPKANDNTHRTYAAYLPLVSACRPDWNAETVKRKTFCLITMMQQVFLRQEAASQLFGIDLKNETARQAFHTQILHDLLEV